MDDAFCVGSDSSEGISDSSIPISAAALNMDRQHSNSSIASLVQQRIHDFKGYKHSNNRGPIQTASYYKGKSGTN
jgi:hypothetical protein